MSTTLWALERDGDHLDYIAAPSFEAAAAACTAPGDTVRPWALPAIWHAEALPDFLDAIDCGVLQ